MRKSVKKIPPGPWASGPYRLLSFGAFWNKAGIARGTCVGSSVTLTPAAQSGACPQTRALSVAERESRPDAHQLLGGSAHAPHNWDTAREPVCVFLCVCV